MSVASWSWTHDPHTCRRVVRQLVRKPAETSLSTFERETPRITLVRAIPWDFGLVRVEAGEPGTHWLLAVRPMDERARWEHLSAFLRVMGVPADTSPLVAVERTPTDAFFYWLWRPRDARVRNAPDRPGTPAHAEVREVLRASIERTYDLEAAALVTAAEARQGRDEPAHPTPLSPPPSPWTPGAALPPDARARPLPRPGRAPMLLLLAAGIVGSDPPER